MQTVLPLSNGGAIKITTALYYTPNDRSIQAQGIVPDVEVKDANRSFESHEADLAGHISNPLGGKDINSKPLTDNASEKAEAEAKPDSKAKKQDKDKEEDDIISRRNPDPAKDAQLRAALDLIKDPAKWQKSLGEAAKKPVPKKEEDTTGGE